MIWQMWIQPQCHFKVVLPLFLMQVQVSLRQYYRWWDLLTILGENNGNSNSDKRSTGVLFRERESDLVQGELAYSMDASNSGGCNSIC